MTGLGSSLDARPRHQGIDQGVNQGTTAELPHSTHFSGGRRGSASPGQARPGQPGHGISNAKSYVKSSQSGTGGSSGRELAVEPFIAVIVRHGGKHVEEKLVRIREYLKPLDALAQPRCLGTRNVLLITETASVVSNFSAACAERGWNCFYTAQRRLDLDIDPYACVCV